MYFDEKSINDKIKKNIDKKQLLNLNKLLNNSEITEQLIIANNNSISKNPILNIRLNILLLKINNIEYNSTLKTIVIFYYFRNIIKNNIVIYEEIKSNYKKYDIDFDMLVDTFIQIYNIACKEIEMCN